MENKYDQLLMESPLPAPKQISTSEYSMQVNMDEELGSMQNNSDKKKAKKKQYKRKRKQKIKNEEQQARVNLGQIIKEIYEGGRSFQSSKNEIEGSLSYLVGGEKFHIFLNEVIKIQVKGMQGEILDYTQSIINENSLDKNSNNQQFYLQMVGFIYGLYKNLQRSSQQIEKIINLYMCLNANTDQHMEDQYGLDRSTFKFMINSDDTIKVSDVQLQNLLKICRKRISGRYTEQIQQIKELSQMICHEEIESFYEDDEQLTEKSTSIDEEQEENEEKKKKKKRKLKDCDFSSSRQEVIKRLNEMVIIEEKRSCSGVSQEWVDALKLKYEFN